MLAVELVANLDRARVLALPAADAVLLLDVARLLAQPGDELVASRRTPRTSV